MPRRPRAPAGRSRPYQVFISHATLDKWVATVLCEKIDAVPGVVTFRDDRDIRGGDDIPDELREQIRRSNELVVLLTPVSVTRPWVILEIGAAWQQGIRIATICYHVGVDQVPSLLQKKKAYALNEFDRYLEELRDRAQDANR